MEPSTPAASVCAIHEGVASVGTCSHCGNFGCGECLGTMGGAVVCRTCVISGQVNPGLTPWDRRDELGFMTAVWNTIKGVTFGPTQFFEQMGPTGKIGPAIGEVMSEEIVDGAAHSIDITLLNLRRFAEGNTIGAAYGTNRA